MSVQICRTAVVTDDATNDVTMGSNWTCRRSSSRDASAKTITTGAATAIGRHISVGVHIFHPANDVLTQPKHRLGQLVRRQVGNAAARVAVNVLPNCSNLLRTLPPGVSIELPLPQTLLVPRLEGGDQIFVPDLGVLWLCHDVVDFRGNCSNNNYCMCADARPRR